MHKGRRGCRFRRESEEAGPGSRRRQDSHGKPWFRAPPEPEPGIQRVKGRVIDRGTTRPSFRARTRTARSRSSHAALSASLGCRASRHLAYGPPMARSIATTRRSGWQIYSTSSAPVIDCSSPRPAATGARRRDVRVEDVPKLLAGGEYEAPPPPSNVAWSCSHRAHELEMATRGVARSQSGRCWGDEVRARSDGG